MNIKEGIDALNLSDDDGVTLLGPVISLVSALTADSKNPKISRAVSMAGLALTASSLAMKINKNLKTLRNQKNIKFTVTIEEGDLYDEVKKMMYATKDVSDFASMGLDLYWNRSARSSSGAGMPEMRQSYEISSVGVELILAGHKVLVTDSSAPPARGGSGSQEVALDFNVKGNNKKSLEISCDTAEIRSEVVEYLSTYIIDLKRPNPRFFVNSKWASFTRNSDIPVRPKESVILKEGQMDRILDYLKGFLDQEEDYVNLGIPYRTGVLLCGNPGSGKSSTASAIAFELGLDVYFISISSIPSDEDLISLMEDVPPRSIVILEDIDVAKATKERSDEGKGGVTMSGLLNSLDGLVSPHGVITLMTTNHRDSMDPAIIRPGRVDLEEYITEIDDFQLRGICEHFLGFVPEDLPYITESTGITSAAIVGIFKKYIPNIEDAAGELIEFLKEKDSNAQLVAKTTL